MKDPKPRIRMLDGFNEGWIEFERGEAGSTKGDVALETVLRGLIEGTTGTSRQTSGSVLDDPSTPI
jgi:hypothetical protein